MNFASLDTFSIRGEFIVVQRCSRCRRAIPISDFKTAAQVRENRQAAELTSLMSKQMFLVDELFGRSATRPSVMANPPLLLKTSSEGRLVDPTAVEWKCCTGASYFRQIPNNELQAARSKKSLQQSIISENKEATMKHKTALLFILILLTIACNLPGTITATPAPPSPTVQPSISPTIAVPETSPTPTLTPTETFPPADLPFTIDCSALPATRQADCDSFIAATRDQVYPILREVTGVSLSKCYKGIHYIILPTDPMAGAGGISAGDTITYNQRYSVDLPHRYDVHEILHSVSSCAGALDRHVLHGLVLNYVYDRLGVHDPGYFDNRSSENLTIGLDFQLEKVKTASGSELIDHCMGILSRKTTIAYFDLGGQSVQSIYRGTIAPPEILTSPNTNLVNIWGTTAPQIEALLETLEQDFKYSIDVPECGY